MNIIKINAGMPNTLSDIATPSNDQALKPSNMQGTKSKSADQMSMLMSIIKETPESPFHTQVIQSIKSQVQSDYYKVDINALVSHLFHELSFDGVA